MLLNPRLAPVQPYNMQTSEATMTSEVTLRTALLSSLEHLTSWIFLLFAFMALAAIGLDRQKSSPFQKLSTRDTVKSPEKSSENEPTKNPQRPRVSWTLRPTSCASSTRTRNRSLRRGWRRSSSRSRQSPQRSWWCWGWWGGYLAEVFWG